MRQVLAIPECIISHIFAIMADSSLPSYDQSETSEGEPVKVKVICLGDSAVGKSKYGLQLQIFISVV